MFFLFCVIEASSLNIHEEQVSVCAKAFLCLCLCGLCEESKTSKYKPRIFNVMWNFHQL